MQTRTGSAVEALANIVVGFSINWTANMLVLPLFGFAVTGAQAFGIGLIFTVISLVRSYVLRRWFNGLRFGNKPAPAVRHEVPAHILDAWERNGRPMQRMYTVPVGREHAP